MNSSCQVQELSCPKCFKNFSEFENIPYILPCNHTYCHQCLQNLDKSKSNSCYKCYKSFKYDLKNNRFPVNSAILDSIQSSRSSNSETEAFTFDKMRYQLNRSIFKSNESREEYFRKYISFKRKVKEIDGDQDQDQEEDRDFVFEDASFNKKRKIKYYQDYCSVSNALKLLMEKAVSKTDYSDESQMNSFNHDRSEQEQNFKSFFEISEIFFISSEKTNKRTTYFIVDGLMYINSFPQQISCKQSFEIKMNVVRPFIQKTFIKFAFGCSFSLVEFEMFDSNCTRAQHFLKRCLGEEKSFLNAEIYNHNRVGLEGESFCIGIEGDNDTDKSLNYGCYKNSIREGYVTAAGNVRKINHFRICLENWDSGTSYTIFGRVTKGLNDLKYAMKNNLELKILECGVIADPTIKKLDL